MRAPAYLEWIRNQPCAWDGTCGVEASHHPEQGHGRMGTKTDDLRALPLSSETHHQFHQEGTIGSMSPAVSRQWIETQINRHLKRYMVEVMGVGA